MVTDNFCFNLETWRFRGKNEVDLYRIWGEERGDGLCRIHVKA